MKVIEGSAADGEEVKRRTAVSIVWNVLGRGSVTLTSFVVFLVLARLLTPAEFGLFALASIFVDLTRIIASSGWSDAIVRSEHVDDELLDTAFWANLGLGVIIAIVALCLAVPYARFTGQPGIAPLLFWLAPLVPLTCLGSVHVGRGLHGFGYRKFAIRAGAANMLGGLVAIIAAWAGMGVWSLVAQAITADVVGLVVAWVSWPWMPGRKFALRRFRELFAFTSTMMITQLLWLLLVRTPDIFIARTLGSASLGAYRIAFRMFELLGQLVMQPIAAVGITTFSRLRGDRIAVENAYARIAGILALAMFPIMAGFAVVAPELIPMLFGKQWAVSVLPAQVLMGLMVPYLLSYFDAPIFGSVGRPISLMKIAVLQVVLTILLAWLAAPYGLAIVAASYVLRSLLTLPYQQYLMWRDTGIRAGRIWAAVVRPLAAAIVMFGGVYVLRFLFADTIGSPLLRLAVLVPAGAAIYAATLLAVGRREALAHLTFIRSVLQRKPGLS